MIPFIAVVLAAAPAPCGPLDLPTAIALAAARSDEVALRRAEVATAEADRAIARAVGILPIATATLVVGPSPEAHGTILESLQTNRKLGGLGVFDRIDVQVAQPLWAWGQTGSAKRAAEAGLRARELLVEDTRQQVEFRVLQAYWGISLARRLLVIADDVKGALADADKRIAEELSLESGEATQEDKYRVAVFRAEVLQRTTEAEKGRYLARVAIAAMLGIPEPELVLKDEPLPVLEQQPTPSVEQAIQQAEQARADLRAVDHGLEALEAQAQASRAALLPQVFAAGTFSWAWSSNRDRQTNPWINDDFQHLYGGVVIGLRQNLSIHILLAQVQKAESEMSALRKKREGLARLIEVQTEQALADLRAASEKHAATQAALSAGRSWFRSASLNFGIGVTDTRGLIDAYTGYVKTQAESAQATFELLLSRGHLDQVTGKPLISGESTCVLR